ncbi:mariner Mos1 transposase [Trichonephila clavipes]|nr:mariner Mos1 transposase [Trichonephila clavipes]
MEKGAPAQESSSSIDCGSKLRAVDKWSEKNLLVHKALGEAKNSVFLEETVLSQAKCFQWDNGTDIKRFIVDCYGVQNGSDKKHVVLFQTQEIGKRNSQNAHKEVYKDEAITSKSVHEWFKRFRRRLKKNKTWSEKSSIKTMLIAFFDSKGLIYKEFLPESTYAEVLKRLLQRMRRLHSEYAKQSSCILLHDNARPHTALVVRQFLAANGAVTLDYPLPTLFT